MTRQPTISTDSVAGDQIKAFIDRIIRMREEKRAVQSDINEIYAEAKGNGLDKTILGKAVLRVEKQATNASELLEQDALLDLYLEAYFGGPSRTHAHARESGDTSVRKAQTSSTAVDLDGEGGNNAPALPVDTNEPEGSSTSQAEGAAPTVAVPTFDTSLAGVEGDVDRQPITHSDAPRASDTEGLPALTAATDPSVAAANSETHLGDAGESPALAANAATEEAGETASSVVPSNVTELRPKRQPTFADKPHKDCLNPEQCGGFSNPGLCPKCKVAAGIDVDAVRVPMEGKIGR